MFSGKAEDRPRVQLPSPADDHPSWTKVSVSAAVGFLVGVVWPHVVGVRLGPSLPADAPSALAAGSASTQGAGAAPASALAPASSPTPAAPAVPAAASVSAAPSAPTAAVSVGRGAVFACRSTDGATLKGPDCGTLPGLDGIVTPRLRKLAECPDAATASGKLHLVAHPDFARGALSIELGRGPNAAPSDALLSCARSALAGASVTGLSHEHPRYSVAYSVTFAPGASGAPADSSPGDEPRAATDEGDASAQVVWEVAIVRDAPKIGKVVARLQRGASVHLGAAKDGWYPVKFGDGFASEGWLYRGAIGR